MASKDYTRLIQRAFGRALRREREAQELSQEELGFRSGVHRTYISELEGGKKCPSLVTVAKLAAGLKVRPSRLLASAESRSDKTR